MPSSPSPKSQIPDPTFTIYSDGGARGNPGPAAAAFVVFDSNHHHLYTGGEFLGVATNNVAEYQGVLLALQYLTSVIRNQSSVINFNLDSKLVCEQLSGNYKIKEPHLISLAQSIFTLIRSQSWPVTFRSIPRSQNSQADAEVNRILNTHP